MMWSDGNFSAFSYLLGMKAGSPKPLSTIQQVQPAKQGGAAGAEAVLSPVQSLLNASVQVKQAKLQREQINNSPRMQAQHQTAQLAGIIQRKPGLQVNQYVEVDEGRGKWYGQITKVEPGFYSVRFGGADSIHRVAEAAVDVHPTAMAMYRDRVMTGKITPETHELRDEDTGLHFIKDGQLYNDLLIVQPLGFGKNRPIFYYGYEYVITGQRLESPDETIKVTRAMVNAYWETAGEEGGPNRGSFAPEKGYQQDENLGADERYNCAAYAKGDGKAWVDPPDMHQWLVQNTTKKDTVDAMQVGKNYIIATQFHFWRAKRTGQDQFMISEKNGASPVYHKQMDKQAMIDNNARYNGTTIHEVR